ncbi:hypothetical protein A9Q94_11915 [Rhodobacterales bacterium 56_14_T64]|nr:hypothetical protein A9Q94_11915 [Rhodobacterales bacterium 56_14_T64]
MAIKRPKPEEIVVKLRQVEVLTRQYGRYGYRRVAACYETQAGPSRGVDTACRQRVNNKCVKRWWKREGLKVPMKQPKKGRFWLNLSRDIAVRCPAGQCLGERILRKFQRENAE